MKKILLLSFILIATFSCEKDDPTYTLSVMVNPNLNKVYSEDWSIRIIKDNGRKVDIEKTQDLIPKGEVLIQYEDGPSDLPLTFKGKIAYIPDIPKGKYFIYVFGRVFEHNSIFSYKIFHYSKWVNVGDSIHTNIKVEFAKDGERVIHE